MITFLILQFKLFGLKPFTNYSISVAVVNDALGADSVSNFSRTVVVTTLQASKFLMQASKYIFENHCCKFIFSQGFHKVNEI